jgi:hypothetical protein
MPSIVKKTAKNASKKATPFPFVLEALAEAAPYTKPMFGALGVYVDEKIVFILREKDSYTEDNGVWVATTGEHHARLQALFPSIRSIYMFGPGPTGWQNIPVDAVDFEESVLAACELVLKRDPSIGKVPKKKKVKAVRAKAKSRHKKTRA